MNLKKKFETPSNAGCSDDLLIAGGDTVPPISRRLSAAKENKPPFGLLVLCLLVICTISLTIWNFFGDRTPVIPKRLADDPISLFPDIASSLTRFNEFLTPLGSPYLEHWMGEIRVEIKEGQDLPFLFSRLGLPEPLALNSSQILKKLEAEHQFRPLASPGTAVSFKFSESLRLESFALDFPRNRLIELRVGQGNTVTPIIRTDEQLLSDRTAFGSIESSFSEAALKAGVDYDVIDDFVDLFSDRVEFKRELQPGDRFTLVYRKRDPLKLSKAGEPIIIAAAMEVNGKQLFVARFQGADGKYRYFDERGQPLGNTFLRYPLKFSRISSYFTNSRFHPVLKVKRPHNGIDFAAPVGTPVRSVADGVVVQAGYNGGAGNMVKIKHGDRYSTAYLHLHSITKGVKVGTRVKRGDIIGGVGSTGLATGPHLHFSFFDRDTYVDPFKIKLPTLDLLPALKMSDTYLKRVLETLAHFQSVDITQLKKILKTPPKK